MWIQVTCLICLFLLFFGWLVPKYRKFLRIREHFERIPGPKISSIFGDLRLVLQQNLDIQQRVSSCFYAFPRLFPDKGIIGVWFSFTPVTFVYKAESLEPILSSNTLIEKAEEYDVIQPWVGNGLATSGGALWRKHRKILAQAFHFRMLETFIPVINEEGRTLVEKMSDQVMEPWIDVLPLLARCTLDIICETSMGETIGAQNHEANEYIEAINCLKETLLLRTAIPVLRPKWLFYSLPIGWNFLKNIKIVRSFTRKVIKQRKAEIIENGWKYEEDSSSSGQADVSRPKQRLAFLDLLLHFHINEKEISQEEVEDEVNTFLFAGYDTIAHSVAWTLYLLGLPPVIQKRVHDELDQVFGTDRDRLVLNEDLKKLKYLDCVIKESQRLYSPAPIVARKVTEDTVVNGFTIPKDTSCMMLFRILHKDPETFPNPQRFIPERFLPEFSKGRHPYAFIPFSAGPRNCIGQRFALIEGKILLSIILRNFTAVSLDAQDKLILNESMVLEPKCALRIRFSPR